MTDPQQIVCAAVDRNAYPVDCPASLGYGTGTPVRLAHYFGTSDRRLVELVATDE